ncbi:MAG: CDP-glycerol glycerophosphotransferase family protein [Lachnospiraceae bacterium]|nr:CDP-glycerol glycerophosphotransferase family protein [Lachnospiraceae bacterium]
MFYDACVLEKKMLFFTPDLNEYMTGRGFYISMAELPGEVVVEEERLREAVLRAYENYDFHYQRQFVHSYLGACDGHATERIIRFIEGRK